MSQILKLLENFSDRRILVVGDLMLDEYLWGHIERISPEAPVPILKVERRESTLGGAGNVVKNLRALGLNTSIIGVVGEDQPGRRVLELLEGLGVETGGIIRDSHRKSTRKVRLMSIEHGQQVFRLDEESNQAACGEVEERIVNLVHEMSAEPQLILCSDYLKGVLTGSVLGATFAAGRKRGKRTIVAPKDADYRKYVGADILMPNLREFARLVGTPPDGNAWLANSASQLMHALGLKVLVVTRGKDGMTLFEQRAGHTRCVTMPTTAQSVYDVTGAGDTALSVFAAAMACGADGEYAVHLANVAAGIVVGKAGTATVSVEEIEALLREHLVLASPGRAEAHA